MNTNKLKRKGQSKGLPCIYFHKLVMLPEVIANVVTFTWTTLAVEAMNVMKIMKFVEQIKEYN